MKDITWQVWGNAREPYLDGVPEKEAKDFVEAMPISERNDQGVYISNEHGDVFYLDSDGEWVEE
jgi:hypothetical protein